MLDPELFSDVVVDYVLETISPTRDWDTVMRSIESEFDIDYLSESDARRIRIAVYDVWEASD